MKNVSKKKFITLMSNLCCSKCKNVFNENSVSIKKAEKGIYTINLKCDACGYDFGQAFVGLKTGTLSEPAQVKEGFNLISVDDVIDAHRIIKNLDKNWKNLLNNKFFN